MGMAFVMIITFIGLYMGSTDIETNTGITGYAVYEGEAKYTGGVIISGLEFKAYVDDKTYYYMFTDDNRWFESKDELKWEERADMGNSIWSGLYYLKSYDADVYFKGTEINDITEFAKSLR